MGTIGTNLSSFLPFATIASFLHATFISHSFPFHHHHTTLHAAFSHLAALTFLAALSFLALATTFLALRRRVRRYWRTRYWHRSEGWTR